MVTMKDESLSKKTGPIGGFNKLIQGARAPYNPRGRLQGQDHGARDNAGPRGCGKVSAVVRGFMVLK